MAERDLEKIVGDGLQKHGYLQVKRYLEEIERKLELLSSSPDIVRSRPEISRLYDDVKVYTMASHAIIYRKTGDNSIWVARIAHGKSDWAVSVDRGFKRDHIVD